jgi:hypothetical protein
MNKLLLIILFAMINHITLQAQTQAVYVDCNTGDDKNSGIRESPVSSLRKALEIIKKKDNQIYHIKVNPGIYVLDKPLSISTEKEMNNKRIIIEASVLPGDTTWTPEKMPVIMSKSLKGELQDNFNFVVSFLINESHVTIRGLKFQGYAYPHTRYFPIARFNKEKTDLSIEQCVFVGDANISQIQAGVIAHGNEVKIDHCVFYKIRNSVVFFQDAGNGIKNGNGITNSIMYGVSHALWTVSPDADFKFENNIVANCRYFWVKNGFNQTKYSVKNCIIVNNKFYTGAPDNVRLNPQEFELNEDKVTKNGEIILRLTGNEDRSFLDEVDKTLPVDYLHVIPGSLGFELGAGIFKNKKQ